MSTTKLYSDSKEDIKDLNFKNCDFTKVAIQNDVKKEPLTNKCSTISTTKPHSDSKDIVLSTTKRHYDSKEDIKDVKKIKKCDSIKVPIQKDVKVFFFNGTLEDKYQPQFLNYMLVGDLVSIMILNSKSLVFERKSTRPVMYQNFCHSAWSVGDILHELKSKKNCYPIAKTVILSVGYNDYCSNTISAVILADSIEKIIRKLQKRGCRDILLTNVPPSAANSSSVDHWKYLQIVNEEILKLSERYDFVGHCNIFKLFCRPNNYFNPNNKEYVTFREINYKVDLQMYNDHKKDRVSFSDLGKTVLGKHVAKSVEGRLDFLRYGQVNKVICSLEVSDSEDVEVVDVKKVDPSPVIIDLDADEGDMKVEKIEKVSHPFDCECKTCKEEHQQLMKDMLSTIESMGSVDEKPVLPL